MATINYRDTQCRDILQTLKDHVNKTRTPFDESIPAYERQMLMRKMDEQTRLIKQAMSSLLSGIGNDRNWFAPISMLMDDILIEIWMLLPLRDRISAAQVCQRWRVVALDTKSLWTEINIEVFSSRKITALLERSGHSPLTITAGNKKLDKWCLNNMVPPYPTPRPSGLFGQPPMPSPGQMRPPVDRTNLKAYFFHQFTFDKIIGRAERLEAAVGVDKSHYVTYRTLKTPMPYLKSLVLREDTRVNPWGAGSISANQEKYRKYREMPDIFFGGVTPQLREVSFTLIHAPWNDPIYRDLTRLKLSTTRTRAKPSEMLRLLANCPQLVYLGIHETMSPIVQNHLPNLGETPIYLDPTEEMDMVFLNHLKRFNLEESDAAVFPKLMSRIRAPVLENPMLLIPDTSCLMDYRDGGKPYEALRLSFSQTTGLQITGNHGQLNVSGVGNRRAKSPRFAREDGWSVCCRPRTRVIPTLPAYANGNTTNAAWNPVAQLHPSSGINPLCDLLQFLHVMERTGVVYSQIEKLSIAGTMDGTVYRSVFSRCFNLKALVVSTAGGLNVLKEYMQDRHCPSLAWLHLERYSEPANELADWLELRKQSGHPLRRVIVSVHTILHPPNGNANWNFAPVAQESSTLDAETKRRIEAALEPGLPGRTQRFEWRTARPFISPNIYDLASQWDEEEEERAEFEKMATQVGLTGESMRSVLDLTTRGGEAMDIVDEYPTPTLLPLNTDVSEEEGIHTSIGSPVSPETPIPPLNLGNMMPMYGQTMTDFDEDEEWDFGFGPSMW